MKIHEYQAKAILKKYGVPVPQGIVVRTPEKAVEAAKKLSSTVGYPLVIKSQVLVGGRGKAGGVKLVRNEDEVRPVAEQILGMTIKGEKVKKVLVEQGLDIRGEIYLGIIVDRARKKPVFMTSAAGGVEIEQVAAETPEKILFSPVEPLLGLTDAQIREMVFFLGLPKAAVESFRSVVRGLYKSFVDNDCSLAEINPLVLTGEERVIAADAKMNFDDNALYRHPDIAKMRDVAEEAPLERKARQLKLNYVKLDGKIGCIVNGAGLAMATMDIVKHYGGEPANFLDIGGGAKSEQVAQALKLIISDKNVNTIFFNIFGGIVRCDLVAEGILEALKQFPKWKIPIVIRLSGTNEEKAREMLRDTALISVPTMSEGAKKAVELSMRQA
ncbi:MAG: ADP-forming succinate--CoA ligase subunit beta [Candidatus Hydrogenedentota bacterium]|jgi:succinyl-CoA synthetase beta subunit|uniref:Succinate--CoA ligase [ADP-forming] subunit beta n=1 Tax=Sumerlaea chitinivorans TaxID=2250252 RepID=A0A2Z4Y330_SUMC1|nr:Succinyl-CoA ligase [ADP-forming] beta chain [Candidatus Sumerlaea chitinivorans]RMH30178.1 MAG: ADP-forming succinate--CoA ligase subunit beta [Candidatus Hydrogenedentota bacterium]GIX44529.1 MAG: succinate--CoA ligase [ADP-forming] subunit beta [Candidatus Sumerlaea sp.]